MSISMAQITMEHSYTHKKPSLSMFLDPPRPQFSRQRSNSLPAGLANMNAMEAGMLFSAAEKATARRRRPYSIHTPCRIEHATREPMHQRFDSGTTVKPSPPAKDTPPAQTQSRAASSNLRSKRPRTALRDLDINQAMNGRSSPMLISTLNSLPVPAISPMKRQVGTNSLKNYADGLFQFTQTRLVSTIPNILSPPPTSMADVFTDSDPLPQDKRQTLRPEFESKFSDWSVTTAESRQSVIQEIVVSSQPFENDPSLMSPDSFFGDYEDTPRRRDFSSKNVFSGYPSSEAYGPQPGEHQPLTPPPYMAEPMVSPLEEFSYFSNYDQYMEADTSTRADIMGATDALEHLTIGISPMEQKQYLAATPSSTLTGQSPGHLARSHIDTSIRRPELSGSCPGTPCYTLPSSSPATPYQLADVAVRIPHWLIGAIG